MRSYELRSLGVIAFNDSSVWEVVRFHNVAGNELIYVLVLLIRHIKLINKIICYLFINVLNIILHFSLLIAFFKFIIHNSIPFINYNYLIFNICLTKGSIKIVAATLGAGVEAGTKETTIRKITKPMSVSLDLVNLHSLESK